MGRDVPAGDGQRSVGRAEPAAGHRAIGHGRAFRVHPPVGPGRGAGLCDFFAGFRRYFWRSWLWTIVAGAGFIILGGDVVLTGRLSSAGYVILIQGFFLALLFLWAFLLLYAFPLIMEQE